MSLKLNGVYPLDALKGINELPDKSVQCLVTSPPYFRQRDYGVKGQWGQEDTPEEYITQMVMLFRAAKRVLRDDGTAWVVIGDGYVGGGRGFNLRYGHRGPTLGKGREHFQGYKRKDLFGIPWMLALALRNDGWFLRQDIIWFKRNGLPESIKDRCTRSHEYIFMFTLRTKYYYDHLAIATPLAESSVRRVNQDIYKQKGSFRKNGGWNSPMKASYTKPAPKQDGHGQRQAGFNARYQQTAQQQTIGLANRKSVWPIATAGSREEHFASFPGEIPALCIKAGSRPLDTILDPFAGTGTTLLQASVLGRQYIGFDINPKYVTIARRRLRSLEGVFYQG